MICIFNLFRSLFNLNTAVPGILNENFEADLLAITTELPCSNSFHQESVIYLCEC